MTFFLGVNNTFSVNAIYNHLSNLFFTPSLVVVEKGALFASSWESWAPPEVVIFFLRNVIIIVITDKVQFRGERRIR